ncbi:SusC/RagA family TonB-linked outer membrane protein [Lutibacter sp.]|uniref:SusC/RagA family TonB-linked outer membrane protein n=1 Tax=Lutibacter sp. TaxID=1925666 RepID=UPI003566E663
MKSFLLSIFLSFMGVSIMAQTYEIKGNVADSNGMPLPGVTIVVKGTKNGATTDFDGNFVIANVQKGNSLVFSYVGYATKEVVVSSANSLTVVLAEDMQSLDEVVVVGYGTQKKSVVTGAISSVKAEDLEGLPVERVEQALQGRVSGVVIAADAGQPGSSSTVRVRGITTIGTNDPLWVIDGVVVSSSTIGYLNQSDIQSIEVLKDAASLAIYGARAAAGVILVTTKKGKQGKINVGYSTFYGVSKASKKLSLLNASEYAAIMNEKSVADGGSVVFSDISSLGKGTDWQDVIFNDSAARSSHEFSLSGGNEVSTFYASFGISDQEGIVLSDISNFNRKSIRLNSTHKISDYVKVGQTLGYAHKRSMGITTNSEYGGPLSSAINLDPITPAVITDPVVANSSLYTSNAVMTDEDGNPYGISSYVGQEMSNPLAYQETVRGNYGWSDDVIGNVFVEITPMEGLVFKSAVSGTMAYWGSEGFVPEYYLQSSIVNSQNYLYSSRSKSFGWNLENTASYSKSIGVHDFSVLLGQGVYIDGISSGVGVTYYDLPVTTREEASFNFSVTDDQITGYSWTGTEHKVISLFSRLNYNYDEKYLFTGIIRRDGSSRFGDNNKFGFFPSFSAGWVTSKESFWPENDVVSKLKIRGGFGVTGNDAIGDFGYLALVGGGRNYTFGEDGTIYTGYSPNAPDNPDLKWEETSQTNIGFEARVLENFDVNFDYFIKKTSGILQDVEIPGYVGASGSPLGNVADMKNSGLEFEVSYNKSWGDLNFRASGNVSYLENEVTNLGEGKEFISGEAAFQSMGDVTRIQVGQSINAFYGYQTNGIFQNIDEINSYVSSTGTVIQPDAVPGDFKWVDNNGDGEITDDDRTFLGTPLPKYTFGLTLNLDYKGFDFMVFTQGVAGNKIFQGLRRLDVTNANHQTSVLQRWTGEGTSNDYPRLTNSDPNGNFGKFSDFYLEDGDFIRFKTIQLGYTLPSEIVQKIGASKLRLYVTGENLFTITNYSGYDPEIGGSVMGIDRGYYPQAQSFMMGLNVQF